MWSYPSNSRPASWDHYYGHSSSTTADEQRRALITSGIAAGLTLIVFLAIFLITLGCRFYNNQIQQQRNIDSMSFFGSPTAAVSHCNRPPLPSYENALQMPAFPFASSSPSIDAPFRVPKPIKTSIG